MKKEIIAGLVFLFSLHLVFGLAVSCTSTSLNETSYNITLNTSNMFSNSSLSLIIPSSASIVSSASMQIKGNGTNGIEDFVRFSNGDTISASPWTVAGTSADATFKANIWGENKIGNLSDNDAAVRINAKYTFGTASPTAVGVWTEATITISNISADAFTYQIMNGESWGTNFGYIHFYVNNQLWVDDSVYPTNWASGDVFVIRAQVTGATTMTWYIWRNGVLVTPFTTTTADITATAITTLHFTNWASGVVGKFNVYINNITQSWQSSGPAIYNIYPNNITIDTGNDGYTDIFLPGDLSDPVIVELNKTAINRYVSVNCSSGNCHVPIKINSTSLGNVIASDFKVTFNATEYACVESINRTCGTIDSYCPENYNSTCINYDADCGSVVSYVVVNEAVLTNYSADVSNAYIYSGFEPEIQMMSIGTMNANITRASLVNAIGYTTSLTNPSFVKPGYIGTFKFLLTGGSWATSNNFNGIEDFESYGETVPVKNNGIEDFESYSEGAQAKGGYWNSWSNTNGIENFNSYSENASIRSTAYWDAWTQQVNCTFNATTVSGRRWGHFEDWSNDTGNNGRISPIYILPSHNMVSGEYVGYAFKWGTVHSYGNDVISLRGAWNQYFLSLEFHSTYIKVSSGATLFTGLTAGDTWDIRIVYDTDTTVKVWLRVNSGSWQVSAATSSSSHSSVAAKTLWLDGQYQTGSGDYYITDIVTSWNSAAPSTHDVYNFTVVTESGSKKGLFNKTLTEATSSATRAIYTLNTAETKAGSWGFSVKFAELPSGEHFEFDSYASTYLQVISFTTGGVVQVYDALTPVTLFTAAAGTTYNFVVQVLDNIHFDVIVNGVTYSQSGSHFHNYASAAGWPTTFRIWAQDTITGSFYLDNIWTSWQTAGPSTVASYWNTWNGTNGIEDFSTYTLGSSIQNTAYWSNWNSTSTTSVNGVYNFTLVNGTRAYFNRTIAEDVASYPIYTFGTAGTGATGGKWGYKLTVGSVVGANFRPYFISTGGTTLCYLYVQADSFAVYDYDHIDTALWTTIGTTYDITYEIVNSSAWRLWINGVAYPSSTTAYGTYQGWSFATYPPAKLSVGANLDTTGALYIDDIWANWNSAGPSARTIYDFTTTTVDGTKKGFFNKSLAEAPVSWPVYTFGTVATSANSVEFTFNAPTVHADVANWGGILGLRSSDSSPIFIMYPYNGNLVTFNNAATVTLYSYSANTDYKIVVYQVDDATFYLTINGVRYPTSGTYTNYLARTGWFSGLKIQLDKGNIYAFYIDDILTSWQTAGPSTRRVGLSEGYSCNEFGETGSVIFNLTYKRTSNESTSFQSNVYSYTVSNPLDITSQSISNGNDATVIQGGKKYFYFVLTNHGSKELDYYFDVTLPNNFYMTLSTKKQTYTINDLDRETFTINPKSTSVIGITLVPSIMTPEPQVFRLYAKDRNGCSYVNDSIYFNLRSVSVKGRTEYFAPDIEFANILFIILVAFIVIAKINFVNK